MNARAPLAAVPVVPGPAGTGNDFSDVSYAEALQRAVDLIPVLKSEAAATETATRLTDTATPALESASSITVCNCSALDSMRA
jgi:hypothetical protein